ncbi:MAG: hypothetical protein EOO67_14000, partial [Microbacterium sp.]
ALASRSDRSQRGHGSDAGSRLVGRDRELAAASGLVAEVAAGGSRTVFVTGQAGIGKTRFTKELRSLFEAAGQDRPTTWLEGTCLSYGLDEPYLPFRQVLRQALGRGTDPLDPMLSMILGSAPGAVVPGASAALSAESLQQAVIDAFVALVEGLAAQGPVAIALDDLHWADSASLRVVEGLVAGLGERAPVLLVLAMRPETDRGAWLLRERTLASRDRSSELHLVSLDRDDERGLISDLVGEGTLPEALETVLLGRTEGNPFYLRELLRSLQDTGAILRAEGSWTFDPGVEVELPDTVERVVLARIDRLLPRDRDLLNTAAVIGREFDLPLLGRIAGVPVTSGSLANLTRLGLIEGATAAEYRFSHPLIQETAYLSMLRRGRAELHGRAAEAIEELADDGTVEHHAVLARHHSAAGHVAEAVRYHRMAALASQRVVALDESRNQLDLAIEAAGLLDPASAAAVLPDLHLLRGHARGRTGDYVGGVQDLRSALVGARSVGDAQVEMQGLNELGWLTRVHGYEEDRPPR